MENLNIQSKTMFVERYLFHGKLLSFSTRGLAKGKNRSQTIQKIAVLRFIHLNDFISHQLFLLAREWSKRAAYLNMPQLKPGIFPNVQRTRRVAKIA